LAGRLKIRVIPTIALVKDNKTKDFVVGFTDLGNRDDFSTDVLEWRIARAQVIEYSGDLLVPPAEGKKKTLHVQSKRTIRSRNDSDSSDGLSD
ncbi:thioredoxin domain-containing protein 9, partial [Zerene cesonia]|uniref:thioredoxin domain-containing protein 9 n=1 Tax=Zerene cesonia TaxID=33412 RepID=UPI0018E5A55B